MVWKMTQIIHQKLLISLKCFFVFKAQIVAKQQKACLGQGIKLNFYENRRLVLETISGIFYCHIGVTDI